MWRVCLRNYVFSKQLKPTIHLTISEIYNLQQDQYRAEIKVNGILFLSLPAIVSFLLFNVQIDILSTCSMQMQISEGQLQLGILEL